MKLFISWSGTRGEMVAEALNEWLTNVIHAVEPWMSGSDLEKGARWSSDIAQQLNDAQFGIICLTSENLQSPWLLFEAGALSKTLDDAYVCPYLLDLDTADLKGPLAQFQATKAKKEDTRKLILTINRALGTKARPEDKVNRAFDLWWPDLEVKLEQIKNSGSVNSDLDTSEHLAVLRGEGKLSTIEDKCRIISAFYSNRDEMPKFKDVIEQAEQEVFWIGNIGGYLIGNLWDELCAKAISGCTVKILLINPELEGKENPLLSMLAEISNNAGFHEHLTANLETVRKRLMRLKKEKPEAASRLQVRLYNTLVTLVILFVDAYPILDQHTNRPSSCRIQIEILPHKFLGKDRPNFDLNLDHCGRLCQLLYDRYNELWNESIPFP